MRLKPLPLVTALIVLLSLITMPAPTLAATAPSGFRLPFIGTYTITVGPCAQHANNPSRSEHEAIDFALPHGTKVLAAASGKLRRISNSAGSNIILISHSNGLKSVYAHLSEFKVLDNTEVAKGQLIALSGNSGALSTGPHLHFAVLSGSTSDRDLSGAPVWIRDLPGINWLSGDPNNPCARMGIPDGFAVGVDGNGVMLAATHSNQCMDVLSGSRSDGADVVQWPCHGGSNQRWAIEPIGSGYYRIVNVNSGRCLDVEGAYLGDGGDIIQWRCHGGDNQSWRYQNANPTVLVNKRSGRCIDVSGDSRANGADIIQWGCHGGANQRWSVR